MFCHSFGIAKKRLWSESFRERPRMELNLPSACVDEIGRVQGGMSVHSSAYVKMNEHFTSYPVYSFIYAEIKGKKYLTTWFHTFSKITFLITIGRFILLRLLNRPFLFSPTWTRPCFLVFLFHGMASCSAHWSEVGCIKVLTQIEHWAYSSISMVFCKMNPSLWRRFWRERAICSLPPVEWEAPTGGT